MKTILVCGDRNWSHRQRIRDLLKRVADRYGPLEVVEGDCEGADRIAGEIAQELGFQVHPVPAEWAVHVNCRCPKGARICRAAGPRRNARMLDLHPNISLVLAFHDFYKQSRGTKDMCRRALSKNIPTFLIGTSFARPLG